MSLKAGRRGLHKSLVDAFGFLKGEMPTGDYYTKTQTDNKFETKTHANNTFQKQTLEVPIEMLYGTKLTVEDALQGLNEEKFTYADNGVLGAKNLISIPSSVITQTVNGVTFTVNRDSKGNVLNVTVNGTASAMTLFVLNNNLENVVAGGHYILTGCPSGGGENSYRLELRNTSDNIYSNAIDVGSGSGDIAPTSGFPAKATIRIASGYTANNLVFHPMLRLASDPDDTYVPYAMTNREITEELTVQESELTDLYEGTTIDSEFGNHILKQGKICELSAGINGLTCDAWSVIAKIPNGYHPRYPLRAHCWGCDIAIGTTGNISVSSAMTNANVKLNVTWITD